MSTMDRRTFLTRAAVVGGGLASMGPLQSFYVRTARAGMRQETTGYGPLVAKGDLALPRGFNYQIIQHQGTLQRDGNPVPGIFDGMAAFPGQADTTILIRNHENRERPGEIPVTVPAGAAYDPATIGGNTKVVVRREKVLGATFEGEPVYRYEVVDSFNILGGTSTNCAGGPVPHKKWITCEEVVKRNPATNRKHGYVFEVDATSDGPVVALPVVLAGRFVHEAIAWRAGVMYLTEDERIRADPRLGELGACFYRYIPDHGVGQSGNLAETTGVLQALKLKNEFHANMDVGRPVGVPFAVEWVTVDQPDHEDDTNNRSDRMPGFTPTRVQAQDKGAASFDRQEGMWAGQGDAKIFFDCTEGGRPQNLGQVWEYDPGRETITLTYESDNPVALKNPDNVVIVPQTQDIFLCEDAPSNQFIRGLTQDGQIYDFCHTVTNDTEFCGATFDPDAQTLYVNQQGEVTPGEATPSSRAVTYAIYGPFEKRMGSNSKNFGTGPGA